MDVPDLSKLGAVESQDAPDLVAYNQEDVGFFMTLSEEGVQGKLLGIVVDYHQVHTGADDDHVNAVRELLRKAKRDKFRSTYEVELREVYDRGALDRIYMFRMTPQEDRQGRKRVSITRDGKRVDPLMIGYWENVSMKGLM